MKFRPAPWSRPSIWLLVLASLATTAPAAAQKLAILGLSSKDGDDEPAAALTAALRTEAAADTELQLSDTTALLSQLVVLHDCEIADAACRDTIARQLDAGALLYGAIRRTDSGHKVELHYYSMADNSLTHASRELTIEGAGEAELSREASSLLRELRGLDAPEPEAIAPEPAPERVSRPARLLEPQDDPEPQDAASSNDWLGYSLLGVAAVSAGLVVFSWSEIDAARNDSDFRAYREAVGRVQTGAGVDDVCDEADAGKHYFLEIDRFKRARSACGRGATFEILQWVFVGSALVSAGFGVYFLLDDEGEPDAARASLMPIVGKDDAGLQLRIQL
jgi:hypothetical protein